MAIHRPELTHRCAFRDYIISPNVFEIYCYCLQVMLICNKSPRATVLSPPAYPAWFLAALGPADWQHVCLVLPCPTIAFNKTVNDSLGVIMDSSVCRTEPRPAVAPVHCSLLPFLSPSFWTQFSMCISLWSHIQSQAQYSPDRLAHREDLKIDIFYIYVPLFSAWHLNHQAWWQSKLEEDL